MCNIIGTSTNTKNQTPTPTVGTKETIMCSKAATDTGTTRRGVRKTSRKKHLKRKERRNEKEQKKKTDRLIDRIAMAMDCGTGIEGGQEKSETPTTDVSNEDESSAAEAHELLIDHLQYECFDTVVRVSELRIKC